MRRWHRLLAPWFALLLLLLAATGLATQATDLLDRAPAKTASADAPAAPSAMKSWNHWFKHIHSGETLGPVGIALNIGGGVALLFFAGSGFWMYLTMWLNRRRNRRKRQAA
ncbi:hypothetical protein [Sphingomonas aquatilis]|uniref:Iron-regulated membrane protein n=1 Tax=Sphingomonas aquatilis TaxID=93063 RepID=A0AAW3TN28_9SPHN|nr:hypothetical protein [Sphingomonas aquatilis]MBB3874387.1 putative iron-regulated membrane protein [Sphingomonas aquatilis]MCI4653866.1 hypothetical protein [Sphingomonas aquatilis]GEM71166.1 hypothetical protein SAQ01S_09320 [Sphingomonas aquatilis NBRC 16722]